MSEKTRDEAPLREGKGGRMKDASGGTVAVHASRMAHPSAFSFPVRIYYEDTDSGGVVYYANYLKYLERARTEWLRSLGFEQTELAGEMGVIFVVREVLVEYLKPARFNDLVQVTARVAEMKRASLVFDQAIERANGREGVLVRGRITVACVDAASFRPVAIPALVKHKIEGTF